MKKTYLEVSCEELRIRVRDGRVVSLVGLKRKPMRFQGSLHEVLHIYRSGEKFGGTITIVHPDRKEEKINVKAETVDGLFFGQGGFFATAFQKLFDLKELNKQLDGGREIVAKTARVYDEICTISLD